MINDQTHVLNFRMTMEWHFGDPQRDTNLEVFWASKWRPFRLLYKKNENTTKRPDEL